MKYKISLFVFRRDLRLYDNTALISALENSEKVICAFFLNPKQLEIKSKETEVVERYLLFLNWQ